MADAQPAFQSVGVVVAMGHSVHHALVSSRTSDHHASVFGLLVGLQASAAGMSFEIPKIM